MDLSEGLVSTAEGMALGTVPIMPASLSCVFFMDGGKGKDGEMRKAASKSGEAGNKYSEAKEHLEGLVRGVSAHSWAGKDREAFENEVRQISQQLDTDHQYALGAQITLDLIAVALDVFAGFAMGIGVALVAQAAICVAADCTVIGAPAAEAEANAFAVACADALETANTALMGAMSGAAALFQVGAIADAAQQDSEGDQSALGNLTQAEIKGGLEGGKAIVNHLVGKAIGNRFGKAGEEAASDALPAAASKAEKEAAKHAGEQLGDSGGEWGGETLSKTILNGLLPEKEGGDDKGGDSGGSEEDAGSYA